MRDVTGTIDTLSFPDVEWPYLGNERFVVISKGGDCFQLESLMDFEIRNWWHVTHVTGIYL